jgi:hypothetical protein
MRKHNLSAGVFLGIWLILLAFGRETLLRDPGSFWHVTTGQRILASGHVPRIDPYSFTRAGQPWVADQWLPECGMAWLYHALGWDGLLLVTATLLAAIYTWLAARLVRSGLHALPVMLVLAMTLLAGAAQFHVRPLVLTLGLFGVTFALLVDVEAGRRDRRQLGWLVPLLILWANSHGGVLAGLGTVALCAVGWCVVWAIGATRGEQSRLRHNQVDGHGGTHRAVKTASVPLERSHEGPPVRRLRDAVSILLLLATLAAVTLVNPYGLHLPEEWWNTLSMPLPSIIKEHAPLNFTDPEGWITLSLAAAYLGVLLGTLPQRPRVSWLLPLAWLVLAIARVRNVPLFAIAVAVALADALPYSRVAGWLARRGMFLPPPRSSAAKRVAHAWLGLVVPLIAVVAAFVVQAEGIAVPVVGRGWARFDSARWPIELLPKLAAIEHSSAEGAGIFNDLNFGGFLIAHTPRLRVFVDDRCSVYGGDFLQAYDRARREDPARIDHWQRQYGFRYALVETHGRFDRYLAGSGQWTLVGRTPAATLYQYDLGPSTPER